MQTETLAQELVNALFTDHALAKFIVDCETLQFLDVNRAAMELYGYTHEEFLAMSILDIRPPEYRSAAEAMVRTWTARQHRTHTVHSTRSGALLRAEIYASRIRYMDRQAWIITVVDISDAARVQDALQDSETLLRAMMDNMPDPVFIKNVEKRYVFVNRAGARLHGFTPENVVGRTSEELLSDMSPELEAMDREVLAHSGRVERMIETRIGDERRVFNISKAPWIDGTGALRGVIGMARDMTEHQSAVRAVSVAEQRFHDLFARMTKGVVYYDAKGRIIAANPAASEIVGVTPEEFKAGPSMLVPCNADGSAMTPDQFPWRMALRTGNPVANLMMGVKNTRTDVTHWLLINVVPEIDDGKVVSAFATFNDVTHLRETEKALRESQRRLEIILRQMPAVMWTTDADLRITWSDGAGYGAMGIAPGDVVGKILTDLVDHEGVAVRAHQGALNGENSRYVLEYCGRWLQIAIDPLRDDSGGISGVLAVGVDITERIHAERRERTNEERFRAMVEYSAEVLIISDATGKPTFSSISTRNVLGYSPEEIANVNLWSLMPAEEVARVRPIYEQHVFPRPGEPVTYTTRGRHKDGTWRDLEVVARNMLNHPVINGVILNIRDVTQRCEAERRLRASEEELRQSQKMEAVGRLAGGIAHDFNNVLTAITGHSELLAEMFSPYDPRMSDVQEIRRAAERATSLTRQLLAFSRRQVLQPDVLDLGKVITDMRKMLDRLIGADVKVECTITKSEKRPSVFADRTQIEQVLLNLAVNARDAMPRGGLLSVDVDIVDVDSPHSCVSGVVPKGCYVRLSVSDTGEGIAAENLQKIFEPFFTTKDRGRGTGLGLSTVYGVVQQSSGHICVTSRLGEGTRFDVLLPYAETVCAVNERQQSIARLDTLRGSETILLVEDEPAVRSMAERVLRKHGYHVVTAADGAKALEFAAALNETISLVLTDVVMPEMSGRELARRFRELYPDVRVLYMSGYTYDEIAQNDMVASELEFLAKPFTPDGLARKVREILAA